MALIKVPINDLDIAIAVDPAISESLRAARTAIIAAGITPSARIVVLEYWVKRQGDPALVIDAILDMAQRWMPRIIGIETIAYQKALLPYMSRAMEKRSMTVPIMELKPDRNGKIVEKKNQRILSMQPFFKTSQVFFQKGMLDLIEEYETFPMGGTVDLLDALSYLFRILVPNKQKGKAPGESAIERLALTSPNDARYWRSWGEKKGLLQSKEDWLNEDVIGLEENFKPGIGEFVH